MMPISEQEKKKSRKLKQWRWRNRLRQRFTWTRETENMYEILISMQTFCTRIETKTFLRDTMDLWRQELLCSFTHDVTLKIWSQEMKKEPRCTLDSFRTRSIFVDRTSGIHFQEPFFGFRACLRTESNPSSYLSSTHLSFYLLRVHLYLLPFPAWIWKVLFLVITVICLSPGAAHSFSLYHPLLTSLTLVFRNNRL